MSNQDQTTEVSKRPNVDSDARGPDMRHGPGPELMGASTLIGDRVRNTKDEELGDIKEIMLDTRTGKVSYAVLSFGGFLGMGDKLFAVPWDALTLDPTHHGFLLDVEKTRLQDAPGFDKSKWPDMSDPSWAKKIRNYYSGSGTGSDLPRS
jgi:sporulation protein YlmC with PRC-barrel domain